jgi:hypothetical protein
MLRLFARCGRDGRPFEYPAGFSATIAFREIATGPMEDEIFTSPSMPWSFE